MDLSNTKMSRLTAQINKELEQEDRRGESKREAKVVAARQAKEAEVPFKAVKGLFSTKSIATYREAVQTFVRWVARHGFYFRDLAEYFPFVHAYFDDIMARKLSSWTVHKYISALCSVFHCDKSDFGIEALPVRRCSEITRTRQPSKSDARYTGGRHDENRAFMDGTGAREKGFHKLRPEDMRELPNGDLQVYLREKGGKERWALVLPEARELVREIMGREPQYVAPNGERRLFKPNEIPKNMTCHSHRSVYCKKLYQLFEARGYANGKLYRCREMRKGKVYDKGILAAIAVNLGHGAQRFSVVVNNYLN